MAKHVWLGLVLAAASVALGSGCQQQDVDEPVVDPAHPQTSDGYFHAARTALCERAVECVAYPNADTCMAAQPNHPDAQTLADADSGLMRYDPDAGARCLAAIAEAECGDLYGELRVRACEDVYLPAVPVGGACRVNSQQCVTGYCSSCDDEGNCNVCNSVNCCMGTCIAQSGLEYDKALGEPCGGYNECGEGAYCDRNAGVCAALPGAGESCAASNECREGSLCDYFGQTCYVPSGAGDACQLETSDGPCAWSSHLYCDLTTVTCQPLPGPGEACDDGGCRGDNLYCATGLCVWRANVGERCPEGQCLGGLECSEQSVCEAPAGADVCL